MALASSPVSGSPARGRPLSRRAGTRAALLALVFAGPALAQDADGAALFKARCSMCHAADPAKPAGVGPNLAGVVGRPAASSAGYNYSSALKASKLTWDKATLDKFLSGPMKMVPGTKMPITIADPAQRAALIAYLATLKK